MTSDIDNIIKGKSFSFTLDNNFSELDRLHPIVEHFGHVHGLEKRKKFEINLVVEEIFTNIISYAYEDKNDHPILFILLCDKNNVTIRIEDDGAPFNLLEAEPADLKADLEYRSIGGLGIHLIRKFVDEIKYQRQENKNIITIRINCGIKEG